MSYLPTQQNAFNPFSAAASPNYRAGCSRQTLQHVHCYTWASLWSGHFSYSPTADLTYVNPFHFHVISIPACDSLKLRDRPQICFPPTLVETSFTLMNVYRERKGGNWLRWSARACQTHVHWCAALKVWPSSGILVNNIPLLVQSVGLVLPVIHAGGAREQTWCRQQCGLGMEIVRCDLPSPKCPKHNCNVWLLPDEGLKGVKMEMTAMQRGGRSTANCHACYASLCIIMTMPCNYLDKPYWIKLNFTELSLNSVGVLCIKNAKMYVLLWDCL